MRRVLRRVGILKSPPVSDRNIHQVEIVGTDAAGLRKRILRAPSWRHPFNAEIEKAARRDDMQNVDSGRVLYAGQAFHFSEQLVVKDFFAAVVRIFIWGK